MGKHLERGNGGVMEWRGSMSMSTLLILFYLVGCVTTQSVGNVSRDADNLLLKEYDEHGERMDTKVKLLAENQETVQLSDVNSQGNVIEDINEILKILKRKPHLSNDQGSLIENNGLSDMNKNII